MGELMHSVARVGAAEVSQAGPGNPETRRLHMVDWRQQPVFCDDGLIVNALSPRRPFDRLQQRNASADRVPGEVVDGLDPSQRLQGVASVLDEPHSAFAGPALELDETH